MPELFIPYYGFKIHTIIALKDELIINLHTFDEIKPYQLRLISILNVMFSACSASMHGEVGLDYCAIGIHAVKA